MRAGEERQGNEFLLSAGACFSLEIWLRAAAPCSSVPLHPQACASELKTPGPAYF